MNCKKIHRFFYVFHLLFETELTLGIHKKENETDYIKQICDSKCLYIYKYIYICIFTFLCFNSITFTQITSDHRVKLENRLREAGLHKTDYARTVIRGATPPTIPRPDQFHTFKFKDQ